MSMVNTVAAAVISKKPIKPIKDLLRKLKSAASEVRLSKAPIAAGAAANKKMVL